MILKSFCRGRHIRNLVAEYVGKVFQKLSEQAHLPTYSAKLQIFFTVKTLKFTGHSPIDYHER